MSGLSHEETLPTYYELKDGGSGKDAPSSLPPLTWGSPFQLRLHSEERDP